MNEGHPGPGGPKMRSGSMFSGYGGLDMAAASVFGGTLAWVCDIDARACKVLAHRFPDVPNLGDVTAVNWATVEPVDLLTAGFPCTDLSPAGLQKGIGGARSGLWVHITKAVRVLRPRIIALENVPNLVIRGGIGLILNDLAEVGYDAAWVCLHAADVGAVHLRERVFILCWPAADSTGFGPQGGHIVHDGRWPGSDETPARRGQSDGRDSDLEWGDKGATIARWEAVIGRPCPDPAVAGRGDSLVINPRFSEWMMGLPDGWVTDVPGLSDSAKLFVLGNGVVPQQAEAALRWLLTQVA